MTSKIEVQMRLCSHCTIITAEAKDDGSVSVDFESDCADIKEYAKRLKEVSQQDYTEAVGSRIHSLAAQAGMTPTCLVPVGVFNACWMEVGMISKRLAMNVESLCMNFVE